jgi:peptidyl-dipeptidase Dcp
MLATRALRTSIVGATLAVAAGCATPGPVTNGTTAQPAPAAATNVLLLEWAGSYGGVPPFDRVDVADFEPALEAAMAENMAEIQRIAADPAPPTFENTIAALERAGRTLSRVNAVYGVWSSNMNSPEFQAVQRVMAPRMAAFSDRITQNEALFRRIQAVYESPAKAQLTPEQQRLTWLRYTNFVRAGAQLDAAAKARMSEINQRMAALFTSFNQNVLADEESYVLVLESEAELAGLPESLRSAAAAEAEARGMAGKWVITNTRSSMEPFLTYADRRDLRERGFRMWASRGDNGDEQDNKAIIAEILALRAERAALLGYETHAHWRLENTMAGTPERALELLEAVWTPAVARVREEVADMQALARAEGHDITIEPWDYRYYAEKVRKARYDLDQDEVKPYLQLDRLRDGMFWVAGELFGFAFRPVADVPVFHPDVTVFEVTDRASGDHVGLFYFDPYARTGKRSGAWMTAYRQQERFDGATTTLVSNNSNFVKGRPGEPVLISWDDATTLFHEFGHALHGLSSNVTYPSLAGTAVARDYVEFPSQILEHWLATPEVLQRFAVHYRTGEPIPQELVDRIERAATFNQGFATTEYLASALIDMKLHLAGARPIDPAVFERETLTALGLPREIIMRHRTPHFQHVFGSDGYSAGYYSYLWSDVLTADAYEAFTEAGGPYDRAVAERLRRHVFSIGNTVDPAEAYRQFRGRDAAIDALMRKRGF